MRRWLRGEPRLTEVLADPVIQLIMRRDRVDPEHLHAFLRSIGARSPNVGTRSRNVELPSSQHYLEPTNLTGM